MAEVALQFLLLGNVLMREISWTSHALHLDLTSSFPTYAASSVAALLFPLGVAAGVYKAFQGPLLGWYSPPYPTTIIRQLLAG